MKKATVMIARDNDGYVIKVDGRATFECSPPLKNFAENIPSEIIKNIFIDLGLCTWMDSTFMGTLAIIGLKAKEAGIDVEIQNINQKNLDLLKELGIRPLFQFTDNKLEKNEDEWDDISALHPGDSSKMAETVLDAHETLIEIDDKKNAPKFSKVVELIKDDISRKKNR